MSGLDPTSYVGKQESVKTSSKAGAVASGVGSGQSYHVDTTGSRHYVNSDLEQAAAAVAADPSRRKSEDWY